MEELRQTDDPPVIGVIGGVGPYAGLDFIRKIFSNTLAARDQDHLNCVLISCPSIITDRTAFLLEDKGEEANPALGMFVSARRLYLAGARLAAVACNTAHAGRIFSPFLAMVKDSLPGLEIVNMLETCALYVKESLRIKRLGLLTTMGTYKSGVYREYFKEEDGFSLFEPDMMGQKKIHDAIYSEDFGIKAHSDEIEPRARKLIIEEIQRLGERGVEAVILGCTELPLAVQGGDSSVPLIDPGLITARRLISLTAPEKLIPPQKQSL
jgi:aspartate racemase